MIGRAVLADGSTAWFEVLGMSQHDGIPSLFVDGREKYRRVLIRRLPGWLPPPPLRVDDSGGHERNHRPGPENHLPALD